MEAQNLIFGGSVASSIPCNQNPIKTLLYPRLITFLSSNVQSVSLKTCQNFTSLMIANKGLRIRGTLQNVQSDVTTGTGDDLKGKVSRKKFAVFVSGGGSNFKSLHEAIANGSIYGDITVLVTNKPECGGAQYARDKGIPIIPFPKLKDGSGLSSNDLVIALRHYKVDFILLAGYLKLIPAALIKAYPRAILNIHPSLLPAFGGKGYYGTKVHEAVLASGARYSGPTIHYVDEEYDRGRILAQRVVPVLAHDTVEELAARVLHEEHKLYKDVVAALCEERIIWREDGVPLIQCKDNPDQYC
ncbi:hypothetical protein M9H77_13310 [Catharanthus roseus]|uniref:Uncharacterized protein n=1 Tax=Catharanthus roseus TaxID=4058 RepID=A0ACC0BJT6_CATRO|nr:hypothetical protein M9H77_13310 [Catharanthus roseus]